MVKEFDLLQPAQISIFLSLFPWLKFYASPQNKVKNMLKLEREGSGCSWTSVQMQTVSLMVNDQVSDSEVFSEWLNNTFPVNQSETIVLMELFLYSVGMVIQYLVQVKCLFLKTNLNLAPTGDSEISENEFCGFNVSLIVLVCVTLTSVTASALIITVLH